MSILLRMQSIYKSFGGVSALTNARLEVKRGEIHALLGENGAGKSTLMNILTGVIPADRAMIEFDRKNYTLPSIQTMQKAGIAFVHQELSVINDLLVYENIFLNREITNSFGALKKKQMINDTRELFSSLGIEIDPLEAAGRLKPSEKQLLEICRALHASAKLLILDEPTTSLNGEEIERLFDILKRKKNEGVSFIFISHKMPEIFAIADRYTVFRNGEFVSSGNICDTTPSSLTSDMIGREYSDSELYGKRELKEPVLRLCGLCGDGFHDVNLEIYKGEVFAFTGLAGSGASEVLQAAFGAIPIQSGKIEIHGKAVRGGIKQFMKSRAAMLPSDRKENSVIADMSILENLQIAEHSLSQSKQIINFRREKDKFNRLKQTLRIKADTPKASITSLSGGNQQKVFLARWLNTDADLLLLDNPTQGVDVGAKAEIYRLILELAENGKTIILNSLELPEIQKVSDRCAVFYSGSVSKIFSHNEITEHGVMMYSTGADKKEMREV